MSYLPFICLNGSFILDPFGPKLSLVFLVFSHVLGFICITFPSKPPISLLNVLVQWFALASERLGYSGKALDSDRPGSTLSSWSYLSRRRLLPREACPARACWLGPWSTVALNTLLSFIAFEYHGLRCKMSWGP